MKIKQIGWTYKTIYGYIFHDIEEHAKYIHIASDGEVKYLMSFNPLYIEDLAAPAEPGHSPGCGWMPGYPESKCDCAPEPERTTALCPACGSDDPKVRLPACQFHYQTIRYDNDPDPWHHTEGNDER